MVSLLPSLQVPMMGLSLLQNSFLDRESGLQSLFPFSPSPRALKTRLGPHPSAASAGEKKAFGHPGEAQRILEALAGFLQKPIQV